MSDLYSRPALIVTRDNKLEPPLSRTLFTLQYRVDHAKSLEGALLLAKKQHYLLIVAAHEPENKIDAINFYKELLKNSPIYERRVVFVDHGNQEAFIKNVEQLGCEHIAKPFNPAELALSIEVLRSKGILTETRIESRYNWTGECKVSTSGEYSGKTMDISSTGLKMHYPGEEVELGTEITVHIPDLGYDGLAKVRWSFKVGEKTLLGLDLMTHIDSEDLKKAIPFAP